MLSHICLELNSGFLHDIMNLSLFLLKERLPSDSLKNSFREIQLDIYMDKCN